ncbi:hypothetical protein [Methylobacterium sp. 1030]|uniref:hypothetical protein n=1 Tax=Methylobacterium sp. 1030 TaxID=3156404 RepID=UPI0033916544
MALTAHAWADFSPVPVQPSSSLAPFTAKPTGADRPLPQAEPAPDVEALIRAARDEGRRAGEARGALLVEQALAAQAQAHAAAGAAERNRWVEDEAAVLGAAFAEQIQALEARLARSTARVLLPFLAEGLRREALREVEALVSPLTEEGRCTTLTLSGPEDLVSALAARLGVAPNALVIRFDAGPDVRVQVDDTVIETRLQAWGERLGTLIEGC